MTDLPIMARNAPTMSSLEIASLTGKSHHHVCRDIRKMLAGIYEFKDGPDLDDNKIHGVSETRDNRGYVVEYQLDKNHTFTLLTGYDAKARFRVVQRWQKLEEIQQVSVPKDYPAALRALADMARALADEWERRAAAEQELARRHAPTPALLPQIPFLTAWWECLGARDVTAGELYRIMTGQQCPMLLDAAVRLFGPAEDWSGRRIAHALRAWSRQVFDGFCVLSVGKGKGGVIWRLERA